MKVGKIEQLAKPNWLELDDEQCDKVGHTCKKCSGYEKPKRPTVEQHNATVYFKKGKPHMIVYSDGRFTYRADISSVGFSNITFVPDETE